MKSLVSRLSNWSTCTPLDEETDLSIQRITVTAARQMGVNALADAAAERRIVLTRWGHDVAVLDTAERLEETARRIQCATEEIVRHYTQRAGVTYARAFAELCSGLGFDAADVRKRADQLQHRYKEH